MIFLGGFILNNHFNVFMIDVQKIKNQAFLEAVQELKLEYAADLVVLEQLEEMEAESHEKGKLTAIS